MSKSKKNELQLKDLPRWDLSHLYPGKDSKELKADLTNTADRARRFQKLFQGKLNSLEGDILASTLKEYEEIEEILGRIGSFAYLLYSENVTDAENAAFYQNISEKLTDISSLLLFFGLEINKIDDYELEQKIKQSAKLRHYAPWIRDVRVMRPHQLSDEVEKVFLETDITSGQSWIRLFDETIADLKFPLDKKVLSCAEVMNLLSNENEEVRKKAAKSIGKVFGDNIRIFTYITNVLAKDKEIGDRWHNFPEPISSRNLSNLIEDEVAQALIDTVKNNYEKLAQSRILG
ncbi:MAG: oligoendopeptidase [Rickettsiaceae bacterium]|nr:oligoendopeptidase [Rickettsiaceae bacterium]